MSRLFNCLFGRRSVGAKSLGPIALKQREYEAYEASLAIERKQQQDAEHAKK